VAGASQSGLGIETIEAWPAAGGGLLAGVVEPAFAGAAPIRRSVKIFHIRIDRSDTTTLMLPYVALEAEARCCICTLVAAELFAPERRIDIRTGRIGRSHATKDRAGLPDIVDIGTAAERSLKACAAAARTMLVCAATEAWGVSADLCHASEGLVVGPDRTIGYNNIAADAALRGLPSSVQLRCGRHVSLWPSMSDIRGSFDSPTNTKVSAIPTSNCFVPRVAAKYRSSKSTDGKGEET
jgi:hypothetical protein